MKVAAGLIAVVVLEGSSAFCPQQQSAKNGMRHAGLFAKKSTESRRDILSSFAFGAGWAVLSQAAIADEKLDFSLPSYDSAMKSKSVGFGDGTEAFLSGDTSKFEKQRQLEAMQKAEEARKQRLQQKKELDKLKEEELKERNKEKAAERARRMKGIFD
eukprot:CAMPEP_0185725452 /NCGR_PEP_ID=MMETSP1171-20130828/1715_1 /TAXON_ID=374046 /ORGANISM="Helicotheca tamensis, Strain CCMP826" /LENGTH=157 /DNA_ID=CAMNT_0028393591 /DNA_START=60 /DNA_END=533 /DNA_ORIENTATION=-